MQCLWGCCIQPLSFATANKVQNPIHSLGSLGYVRPQIRRYVRIIGGLTLAALADLRPGRSMYRGKMAKIIHRLKGRRSDPAGAQRFSRCLKAQPQHSLQSSYLGWLDMPITGYVHFWSTNFPNPATFQPARHSGKQKVVHYALSDPVI